MYNKEMYEKMRADDEFFHLTRDEASFAEAVDTMDKATTWEQICNIENVRLYGFDGTDVLTTFSGAPATDVAHQYLARTPEDLAWETGGEKSRGTHLVMGVDSFSYLLRACAKPSIQDLVKLTGGSLGKMEPAFYSECINHAFGVSKGSMWACIKAEKLAGCMSSQYVILPAKSIMEIATRKLDEVLNQHNFIEGYVSHEYTAQILEFPDADDKILAGYQEKLDKHKHYRAGNIVLAARVSTSDTRSSAATIQPMFRVTKGNYIRLCAPVKVEHKGEDATLEKFEEDAGTVMELFEQSLEMVEKMVNTTIYHPIVTIQGLMKRAAITSNAAISKAVQEHERFGAGQCTMYDVYLSICECMTDTEGAKREELEEKIARIQKYNWSATRS